MQMDIKFELKPKQRPKLAEEIATALHTVPCYQKAPSLAYKIGDCTLEKDGTLRIPDSVDRETVNHLLEYLKEKGFTGEAEQTGDRLTVSMPRESFTPEALENLAKLAENKGGLMTDSSLCLGLLQKLYLLYTQLSPHSCIHSSSVYSESLSSSGELR